MSADIEIIRRTELDGGRVIVTAKRAKPHLTKPFATFVSSASSRYAQRVTDHATEAAALHHHEQMVHQLAAKVQG